MSNLACPVCGSSTIHTERRPDGFHHCINCWHRWKIGVKRPEQTVFDRITISPEVLAEKLVYCLNSSSFRVIDSAGRLLACENEVWGSTILPGSFWTKYEEAIAATVAKLKEATK